EVWKVLRNFHSLSFATDMNITLEPANDLASDQVGAKRILNGVFHETLVGLNDRERTFTYTIDDGPGPVAADAVDNYVGTVRVFPVTDENTSFVLWESRYDSPNDPEVGDFCNPIYQGLLNGLKKHFS
ncbi:MAG: SRPBCC family protein, partial [Xanthomonadales bacterium]|nr:SRPBCC family protein [Xanthomonadales bacterium]